MAGQQPMVRVKVSYQKTMKALKGIAKDQFPWAYVQALNRTAKLAQHAVRTETRLEFHLHTEYIPRGILVKNAQKKELQNFKSTSSEVFTSRKITPFMAWHERGGIKKPMGTSLTIPGAHIRKYKYKTTTGKTRITWKPKRLLNKPGPKSAASRGKGRINRSPFIIPKKGSSPALLVRRIARGDRGLEVLYTFQSRAVIKPTWGFERVVRRVANKFFKKLMEKEMRKAIATAR